MKNEKETDMPRWEAVLPISKRDREVFTQVLEGATYEAVCGQFNISSHRAGQITLNTANKLRRAMLENHDLEPDPYPTMTTVKGLRAGKAYWFSKLKAYYEK